MKTKFKIEISLSGFDRASTPLNFTTWAFFVFVLRNAEN